MGEVRVAGEERLACYTKRREEVVTSKAPAAAAAAAAAVSVPACVVK